jgi:hypothetical protein
VKLQCIGRALHGPYRCDAGLFATDRMSRAAEPGPSLGGLEAHFTAVPRGTQERSSDFLEDNEEAAYQKSREHKDRPGPQRRTR